MPERVVKKQISLDTFSEVVYQENRKKVLSIKKLRSERRINRLMVFSICVLLIYMLSIGVLSISSNILLRTKEDSIRKYETILQNKKIENEQLVSKIEEIVVDKGIKEKAIVELSMTKPTKNHIIYFDKTNRGYVHYDK